MTQAQIDAVVSQMKTDLKMNGPITATLTVYDDFQDWDPSAGTCYKGPGPGAKNMGGHAVRIIGWNKDKTGTPYWMVANSWGTDAGDKGIYWVALGKNVNGIEATVSAPVVNMLNTCHGATFCDTPIDLAATSKIKDPNSPVFLFQGEYQQRHSKLRLCAQLEICFLTFDKKHSTKNSRIHKCRIEALKSFCFVSN